jgi:hypothetical protein
VQSEVVGLDGVGSVGGIAAGRKSWEVGRSTRIDTEPPKAGEFALLVLVQVGSESLVLAEQRFGDEETEVMYYWGLSMKWWGHYLTDHQV